MTASPVLGLLQLAQSQANPDVTFNTAMVMLQALQYGAKDKDLTAPPGSPAEGDVYIINTAAPTGAWSGKAYCVTIFYGGSWRFIPGLDSAGTQIAMGTSQEGLALWVSDEDLHYIWSGTAWGIDGGGASPVTPPTAASFTLVKGGGTTATITDQAGSEVANGAALSVQGVSGNNKTALAERASPGATWTMISKVRANMMPGNYRIFGLYAGDAAGKIHNFGYQALNNGYFLNSENRWDPIDSLSSQNNDSAGSVQSGQDVWMKLVLDATNLTFSYSFDGVFYMQCRQLAKGTFLGTITRAGVFFNCRQDASPVNIIESVLIQEFSLV